MSNQAVDMSDLSAPNLRGVNKAAAFILSLSEEAVVHIFNLLEEDEIRELSAAMSSLGTVRSESVEEILNEFKENLSSTGNLKGTLDKTERLLSKFLDKDKVDLILEDIRGPIGRNLWEKLGNVSEEFLANYLKNEYPQTIALVMSKIKAEQAAQVLAILPESLSIDVVIRMLRMDNISKEIIQDVENTLRRELMNNLARTSKRDTHEVVADIFNSLDRNVEALFMKTLEDKDAESAERVKALMFTFDDLIKLDAQGIQVVIRVVDKPTLALALKGTSEPIKNLFFANMSERAGNMLRDDMANLGAVRVKDVDEAQYNIIQRVKDLAASGEIVISSGKDEGEQLIE